RDQRSVKDCSTEFNFQHSNDSHSGEYSPHSTPSITHPPPTLGQAEHDLLKQFALLFGPDADVNTYYILDSDVDGDDEDTDANGSTANVHIEQTIAEINQAGSPLETTRTTPTKSVTSSMTISPESPSFTINEAHLPHIPSSSTSSSSMYAIRTPSPIRFRLLESPSSDIDGITLTEMVEVHCPPTKALDVRVNMEHLLVESQNGVGVTDEFASQNNNTSCSMSSTLTDSKTVDVRTPIVV
ncbi:probable G-protein coupled receptor CG31760, partial [Bactrocera dorsalis]|uniref:Probable G-protein coupled receptor CG31760 n=1 Tax=Bactrocera dorsalis TaxID=27457 RepID=A0A6J0RFX3_BACDO